MRSIRFFVLVVLVVGAAAGAWYFYWQNLPEAVTGKISRGPADWAVSANVLVDAPSMEIKSEVSGRVVESPLRLGADVKKGDVLFRIDARDLQLAAKRIKTERDAFQKRMDLGSPVRFEIKSAEENVANAERLLEQGKLAKIELERARRGLELLKDKLSTEEIANQERLENLQNDYDTKLLQIEKTNVLAAEDGTVSEIFQRPGDSVAAGAVLARVISHERIVKAQISEENFAGVREGLAANLQLLGIGGKTLKATVERVLPSPDERTKRYTAFLKVENLPSQVMLVPGLTGDAVIMIDRRNDALLADRRGMVGHAVLVVRDGRVRLKPVMIGYSGLDSTEIMSGVSEGDEIVVENVAGFRDGQRVRAVAEASR